MAGGPAGRYCPPPAAATVLPSTRLRARVSVRTDKWPHREKMQRSKKGRKEEDGGRRRTAVARPTQGAETQEWATAHGGVGRVLFRSQGATRDWLDPTPWANTALVSCEKARNSEAIFALSSSLISSRVVSPSVTVRDGDQASALGGRRGLKRGQAPKSNPVRRQSTPGSWLGLYLSRTGSI